MYHHQMKDHVFMFVDPFFLAPKQTLSSRKRQTTKWFWHLDRGRPSFFSFLLFSLLIFFHSSLSQKSFSSRRWHFYDGIFFCGALSV